MLSLRSQISRRVLSYLFLNPSEDLYVNEMAEKFKVDKRNLVKKLKQLTDEGVLVCTSRGNLKLYSLNKKYPLLNETKAIIDKTVKAGETLNFSNIMGVLDAHKDMLRGYHVERIGVFGSFAKDKARNNSDLDLLVEFKKPTFDNYMDLLFSLEALFGRKIDLITRTSLSPYIKPFVEKEVRWYEA